MRRSLEMAAAYCLVVLSVTAAASAQPLDAAGKEAFERVQREFLALSACPAQCLDSLEELNRRFPKNAAVEAAYEGALFRWKEWPALLALASRRAARSGSDNDRATLATYSFQAGNYAQAARLLRELVATNPANAKLSTQVALVEFKLGQNRSAARRLDAVMDEIFASGGIEAAEAATVRGLIYLHAGEPALAKAVLERGLAVVPEYPAGLAALARVELALGNRATARALSERVSEIAQRITEEENRASRVSALSQLASEACVQRDWNNCERRVHELLEASAPGQRPVIYRYLADIYQTAGWADKAAEARASAEAAVEALE